MRHEKSWFLRAQPILFSVAELIVNLKSQLMDCQMLRSSFRLSKAISYAKIPSRRWTSHFFQINLRLKLNLWLDVEEKEIKELQLNPDPD
jgi:hypothetical protein